jgi:hypothetical protein
MDDEQVNNTIAELERCLRTDDPSLARRFRRIRRGDSARSAAVFAALVTAAILLAAGLAIASGVVWFAGVAALLAAFAVAPHREPTAADSPTLQGRRVDQWNEVLPIAGAWSTVASELRAADGLDPWCPTLRRISSNGTHDTNVVSVGHDVARSPCGSHVGGSPMESAGEPMLAGQTSSGISLCSRR